MPSRLHEAQVAAPSQSHSTRASHPQRNLPEQCLTQYNDCLELQGLAAVQFPVVDGAVEWLKRHRTELFVGTVIVIAGVTFVVASAGAGIVVLAPVALLASSRPVNEPWPIGARA